MTTEEKQSLQQQLRQRATTLNHFLASAGAIASECRTPGNRPACPARTMPCSRAAKSDRSR